MSWPSGRRGRTRTPLRASLLAAVLCSFLVLPASADTQQLRNGALPDELLHTAGGVRLAADAAEALQALLDMAASEQIPVTVTDGYRTFEAQVDLKRRKPHLAAPPGHSMHGWGRAIDVDLGRTDMGWFRQHAPLFGWELPPWARPGGSKPEPWHWEYVGTAPEGKRPSDVGAVAHEEGSQPQMRLVEVPLGTLLGHLHLGRGTPTDDDWIEIREGLAELTDVAGHYPGSALPGEEGNAALAGYHRDTDAPLAGLLLLRPGDAVVVRTVDGTDHHFGLLARQELQAHDAWALDPDPLDLGIDRTLTITTGSDDDRLIVSWFAPAPALRCPGAPWSLEPCPLRRPALDLQPL